MNHIFCHRSRAATASTRWD